MKDVFLILARKNEKKKKTINRSRKIMIPYRDFDIQFILNDFVSKLCA